MRRAFVKALMLASALLATTPAAAEIRIIQSPGGQVGPFLDLFEKVRESGQRVVIAAHGNSIRALVKYLDGISDADIVGLNIPNGTPLVYELDANLKPIRHYYLGDQEAIAASLAAVASQGKSK